MKIGMSTFSRKYATDLTDAQWQPLYRLLPGQRWHRGGPLPRDVRVVVHNLFYFGWSDTGHWVRMQGAYDLAQFRRTESAA